MAAEILTLRRLNLAKDYNMYISLIPAALFLFLMLTAAPERGLTAQGRKAPRSISAFFRNSSVLIFGSHLLFKYYGLKIADAAMHYSTDPQILATASLFAQNNLIQYIVVCLCSLAFAAAVLALSRLPVLRVLRYLYWTPKAESSGFFRKSGARRSLPHKKPQIRQDRKSVV